MKKSHQYYIFFMCFVGMMLAALSASFRGFFVPTFKAEFGIDNTNMGMIISVAQASSMAFAFLAGKYCLRFGPKRIIATGYILIAASIGVVVSAKSWLILLAGYCGMASGTAMLVIGLNSMLPMVTILAPAIIMNFGHGIFGFGSTVYQKFLGWYLTMGYDWRTLFTSAIFIFLISACLVWFSPGEPSDDHKNHRSKLIHKKLSFALLTALMFYVTAEFLVGTWIVNFFQEGYGYTPSKASYYSTLFYGVFTVGRLFGGLVFHRISRFNGILACASLAAVSILTGQIFGGVFLYAIGLSGIFFSIIYPTTITIVNDTYGRDSSYFIGISAIATSTGIFMTNLIFGYLNDLIGVQATFNLIPVCLFISFSAFYLARREHEHILSLDVPDLPATKIL
ncbi:MFS transporter [Fusibacter sp. JL216-2]|uniref:MFS transporter n=1 Tax=Fusibacter sp. JL216-2 TaxID=3071453 RepID=UPI003D35615F